MESNMGAQLVNGADLFSWFSSGAKEVYSHVKYLNQINVFPVADGDTGTNMASTLRAMVDKTLPTPSFSNTLQSISQSGLEGARGNSGIIFASYVNGLAMESRQYENVSTVEFAKIAFGAVRHLYASVDNPKEGTLMSVIRDWAKFIKSNSKAYRRFDELFQDAYRTAVHSLENTKNQLDVLLKHNVVDSGAAGFVRFLEGINRVFSGTAPKVYFPETTLEIAETGSEASEYRFCTEALVDTGNTLSEDGNPADTVREMLHGMGDSLIVLSPGGKLKVHIHTNEPELVMEKLKPLGRLIAQKADDMYLQNALRLKSPGGIGIITDSIADVPDTFLSGHHITVVPMGVLADDTAYLDKLTIKLPQLFRAMEHRDGYPTSSQPEPARISSLLSERLEQFDSLIVLCVAEKLSGTYRAITQAAGELETKDKKITVINTKLNSGAQGLLVKLAADLVEKGYQHDDIVKEIESRIPRTKIYVCLNTLAYAVRGGRVPDTIGRLGMKLRLRPIMTLDKLGSGAAFGVAFSQEGLTRKILRLVKKEAKKKGIEAYSIVHGDNLPLAMKYREQLTRIIGEEPEFISEISSAVALHAGPKTVAVCFTQKEP